MAASSLRNLTTGESLDTSEVLTQLIVNTLDETTTITTNISDVPALHQSNRSSGSVDVKLKRIIHSAAIHHFGTDRCGGL